MTTPPRHYAIDVQGHLDDHWAAWLANLTVTHNDDGTTTLSGPLTDQAELHGVLTRLRDLGTTLIAVTPVTPRPVTEKE